jgi:acetylornithine deacetylase/succinyl-diaminopimelate desuccinylase-like protein
MSGTIQPVLDRVDADLDASLERLFELVRFDSISTDPAYRPSCREAAEWLAKDMGTMGFDAAVRDTPGQPMVVGHYTPPDGGSDAPHVLFYGHYDVQPVDPLDLWTAPPFEPHIVEGPGGRKEIFGRGTSDDKGQLMTFLEACRAHIAVNGALPLRITVLLEGEEESGSPSLEPFLEANRDELAADVALVCDTGMFDAKTPAITTMLRGLVGIEVIITGPSRDLHSGMYGGPARNPIKVLTRILAALHDDEGRVQIPGFYDGVDELPERVAHQWHNLGFDEKGFLADVGLSVPAGETGRSVLEQIWSRPTCEINGIVGGYTAKGTKTVIPSQASAKISCRLVGRQDPLAIRDALRTFVTDRLPEDCTAEFIDYGAGTAIQIDTDRPYVIKAAGALKAEFGREPVMMGCGGSIPVVESFRRLLGMDSMLIGFALDDDRIHSPNEKYNLDSFHHGIRSWARVIAAL